MSIKFDESEMFCPSCDGRGDECKIVASNETYVPCRICGGTGKLNLKETEGKKKIRQHWENFLDFLIGEAPE